MQNSTNIVFFGCAMERRVESLLDIGLVIKARRHQAKFRQVDLAHWIGVSPPVLNKIEQGKEIRLSLLLRVLHDLGIEMVLRHDSDERGVS